MGHIPATGNSLHFGSSSPEPVSSLSCITFSVIVIAGLTSVIPVPNMTE